MLSLYRRILREARQWENVEERSDIRHEAKTLFRKNKDLVGAEEIESRLFEGETRIQLAKHYKNPYPRLYYAPKGTQGNVESIQNNYIKGAYRASYDLN